MVDHCGAIGTRMIDIVSWVGPMALAVTGWVYKLVSDLKSQISDLKTKVAVLENNHDNLGKKLDSIESKLDRLIEKEGA